ncbi:MAG TPA: fumarylacetoacetate hydrolase family protein [Acidobacteriaceae bacterium]|jgi:2-keto-4-pentenoate hydratase/2-oxohepta-3-ene-1,7-dioic acid hydratase in catechol pathway|nr:fumarylacetoacetate hydrolase family protein [Acidobacteriaceae bacterium]
MKIVTFALQDGRPRAGVLFEDGIVDLTNQGFSSVLELIASGRALKAADVQAAPRISLEAARLLAPLSNPPRVFCIGLNYRDHAIESKMEIPAVPTVFLKLTSSITGPNTPIVLPKVSTQPDYEAEFALVIGKGGHKIAAEAWRDHVFGYTILNDVSARDVQLVTSQWILGKSFPTFCPIGPALVTADEIPDPHALDIRLTIDGEELQHSNTRELIFRLPELIAYISSIAPLEPGDIISTGTPQGVGLGRKPQRWLKPGETVTVEIEGLGKLVNHTVAET